MRELVKPATPSNAWQDIALADIPLRVELSSLGNAYLIAGADTLIRRLASHVEKQHGWAASLRTPLKLLSYRSSLSPLHHTNIPLYILRF